MNGFRCVLFDFDGVIGKTMEENYRGWKEAFSSVGIKIDMNEYFTLEGLSTEKIAAHFLGWHSSDRRLVENLAAFKDRWYMENNTFSFYEGVEELTRRLKNEGRLMGIVSGGNHERLVNTAGERFLERMDVVVTGDRVRNCKPHPEPYLKAAKALGAVPGECVVVENAPMGIESAKRAGMHCIALCSTLGPEHLGRADLIVRDFKSLQDIL